MQQPPLYLKKREERRVLLGHPWVFSNEVDVARSPLTDLEPGQSVEVRGHSGRSIGSAYVNPGTLIAARLYSRRAGVALDRGLLEARLVQALALRERLFSEPNYRLVYGESDGLPGLVIDRFGEVLVVQIGTAGMQAAWPELLEVLKRQLGPTGILLRNDVAGRALEGLEDQVAVVHGQVPEELEFEENGVRFTIQPAAGQKTGWYFDHRMNRARLAELSQGQRVLDVFSYRGGWGIQAALAGAAEVECVDSSSEALEGVRRNADLNGVGERVHVKKGDAFQVLKELRAEQQRFDVVVLDPPAFIKRRKDFKAGLEAYRRLNQAGMQLLNKDGLLVSASCSHHLPMERLEQVINQAARHLDRNLQFLHRHGQGPDHPVHPALPESAYLKALFSRVFLPSES